MVPLTGLKESSALHYRISGHCFSVYIYYSASQALPAPYVCVEICSILGYTKTALVFTS